MCVYCMVADHIHRYWPYPEDPNPMPLPPTVPTIPVREWTWPQFNEFEDILRRVKELEEKVGGCPCPNEDKTAFLVDIKRRLEAIDKKLPGTS